MPVAKPAMYIMASSNMIKTEYLNKIIRFLLQDFVSFKK